MDKDEMKKALRKAKKLLKKDEELLSAEELDRMDQEFIKEAKTLKRDFKKGKKTKKP